MHVPKVGMDQQWQTISVAVLESEPVLVENGSGLAFPFWIKKYSLDIY